MTLLKSLTLWLEDRNASVTILPVAVEPPATASIETHHPDAAHLLAVLERIAELLRHAGKAGEVQTSAWRELAVRSEALRAALGTNYAVYASRPGCGDAAAGRDRTTR